MNNTSPISVYLDVSEIHKGQPAAVVDPNGGTPRLRVYPAGKSGPFLSMVPGDWDALAAVVAEARAEFAAATTLPGDLPSAYLGRTQASA